VVVTCAGCGNDFEAKRSTAKFCSPTCRKRGSRGVGTADVPSDLVAVTQRELERLGKFDTVDGQQAMVIANRMVSPFETGAAVSSLSKDLSRLIATLGRGAQSVDPVQAAKDEVARKREQKRTAG
jgi:hypothetical protein